jgi:DNA-binding CsgD family transcriptional regulator
MASDNRAPSRVTLSGVYDAFFHGLFERVLTMVDALPPRDAGAVVEAELLRARALVALDRAEEALRVLRGLRLTERPCDEYLTAQMLIGAAYIRLGQTRRAIEVLTEASGGAGSAHRTVHAEIALQLGIANMRERRYNEAQSRLESVPPEADIVHVQAVEYLGWIAYARGSYAEAAGFFEQALGKIHGCRHYDRFIEARTLYGLATLAAELPRLDLWSMLHARVVTFDWSASGLRLPRFWLAIAASFITEMLGDRAEAERWASDAEDCAPGDAQRVVALCRLAAVLGRYGEAAGHAHFVRKARRLYDGLKRNDALHTERSLPLALAEEIATGAEPREAEPLAIYYDEVLLPLIREGHEREMMGALRDSVEAGIEVGRGNRPKAARLYGCALARYERIGYGRRGSVVAYRLAQITGDEQAREYASKALQDAADSYWVKAAFARLDAGEVRLGERHTAILRLVAEGKTNKEIAAARGISPLTARNTVRELLRRFGATNRTELGRIARERGVI